MSRRGRHPGGRVQSDARHSRDYRPHHGTGQHQRQHRDQYGDPWPIHHHHHHHQQQQRYHPQHFHRHHQQQQHQHQHQQQQPQVRPVLHTTGGRPWTMYRQRTPPKKRGRSPGGDAAATAAACKEVAQGGGRAERGTQLTVISYNVLADSLVSFDYIPYCRTWNDAAWRARPGRIMRKVLEFRPSIVCLQEVDMDLYEAFFRKELESLGYAGAYCQRSGGKSDGCATFVLRQQAALVGEEGVAYKVQGHPVLDRLAKTSGADGVMICGDFNMTPDSALYHYMVKGAVEVDGLNRFTVSGQCESNRNMSYGQRKETDNSGILPHRESSARHQGSGCSLGSFLRPPVSAAATSGGRRPAGRGWGDRREKGKGPTHSPPPPGLRHPPPCEECSNRDDAPSTYVVAGDATSAAAAAGYRCPPGAPHGTLFAVLDPSPCRCTAAEPATGERRSDGGGGKRSAKSGGDDGDRPQEEFHRGREAYDPPVLWPSNGDKLAYRRGRGPVAHGLRLRSAYAQRGDAWGTGEPAFSSFHHMFKGTVDYIFYGECMPSEEGPPIAAHHNGQDNLPQSENPTKEEGAPVVPAGGCLRCIGVAEPPLRCDLARFGGLPSPEEPSDHILLAAMFEVTQPRGAS
ncbi:unnamed protein product [Ectocarpus sp. 12 AP-2014]